MSQQAIFSLDLLEKSGKLQAYKIHTLQLIFQNLCINIYFVILFIMLQIANIYSFKLIYSNLIMEIPQ